MAYFFFSSYLPALIISGQMELSRVQRPGIKETDKPLIMGHTLPPSHQG